MKGTDNAITVEQIQLSQSQSTCKTLEEQPTFFFHCYFFQFHKMSSQRKKQPFLVSQPCQDSIPGHCDLRRLWGFHFHMSTRCWALSLWYSLFYSTRHSSPCVFVALPLSFGCETSRFNCSCCSKHPLISALNPVDLNLHGISNTA